eukprot:CAMPEP_0181320258 /NCGR_PEP_ID=MMETSP1101-20121128/18024_1 /TAXON_ID=46948 /ORGANISM="Rhodomonas abbreviata, Strain Caron Lab Isolate" /LENGTH=458 /DNA_ID=CAMNT_0023427943 /DNA_START=16 /DNA_END=1392 /DNA_ORIENTATION=-
MTGTGRLFAASLLVVLVVCADALPKAPLTEEQQQAVKENKEATQFHAEMEALNDKVFPAEEKAAKWTHQSSEQMRKHWASISSRDQGVALDEPKVKAVQHPAQPVHAAKKPVHTKHIQAKHAAHKNLMAQHAAPKPVAAVKETAQQQAADELKHFQAISNAAFPSEKYAKQTHTTAEQMHARRKAEVDAAFPSSWKEQELEGGAKKQGEVMKRGQPLGMDHKEVKVQRTLFGKRKFHAERIAAMQRNVVKSTEEERAEAAKEAQGMLSHFKAVSDQTLPKTPAELAEKKKEAAKLEAEAKAAKLEAAKKKAKKEEFHERMLAKKAAMAKKHEEMMAKHKDQMLHKVAPPPRPMPKSSDGEPNTMGTNEVFLGAPQGGFAKKPADDKEHDESKTAGEEAKPVKLWSANYRKAQAQKKHMPPSSDTEVPSAGTDIAYLGAHQAGYAHKAPKASTHAAKGH